MPKQKRVAALRLAETFNFTVRTIRALPGGKFVEAGEFGCSSREARNAADGLQQRLDAEAEPCRVYVYKDRDPVPIYAGLQIHESWR